MPERQTRFRIESDNDISDAYDNIIPEDNDEEYYRDLRIAIAEWLMRDIHGGISYDTAETIVNTYINVLFDNLYNSKFEEIIDIINLTHKEN